MRYLPAIGLVILFPCTGRAAEPSREQIDFFEKKIRPVLVEHCYKCHSKDADKVKGGLLLDSRAGMKNGGDSGPAVVAGDPDGSLLIKALRFDDLRMPPKGKLPDAVVADFTAWVKNGAHDPREGTATTAKAIDIEAGKKFWAFQPPKRHEPPAVSQPSWPIRPIDHFILAKQEEQKLRPSRPADPRTLIRRLTFDLTGLPPTPDEVEHFVVLYDAGAQAAVEHTVNRLLASPPYGERWARLWLDVSRFAEDQAHIVGNDQALTYPNAYLYRDWAIKALNDDLRYDRFIQLQLAADLLMPDEPETHVALGFIGLGPKYYARNNPVVMADEWEDRVDTVGRALLGLTVACARCHDHKFDPIETEDYYALAGVFASTSMYNRPLDPKAEVKKDDKGRPKIEPKLTSHIVKDGKATDLNVYIRGDVNNKGPVVPRRFLKVLSAGDPKPFSEGSGRKELAEAISNPKNPLTARVIVNRVWAQHFGRALVGTPSNFGSLGERPSHPELLDDLAVRFIEHGWSLKWLHKEMLLSATYQQASQADATQRQADPENRWLARMPRRRLNVEGWRDSLLLASGTLDRGIGGASIDPQDPKARRRTLYSGISRLSLNPLLAMFDFPDPNIHADRRVETTTPLQKLFIMNSPFMTAQAQALGDRLEKEGIDDAARIDRAYRLLFARAPTDRERELGEAFLKDESLQQYAHVLLASNELLYLD